MYVENVYVEKTENSIENTENMEYPELEDHRTETVCFLLLLFAKNLLQYEVCYRYCL